MGSVSVEIFFLGSEVFSFSLSLWTRSKTVHFYIDTSSIKQRYCLGLWSTLRVCRLTALFFAFSSAPINGNRWVEKYFLTLSCIIQLRNKIVLAFVFMCFFENFYLTFTFGNFYLTNFLKVLIILVVCLWPSSIPVCRLSALFSAFPSEPVNLKSVSFCTRIYHMNL